MSDARQRVVEELEELIARRSRLNDFLYTPAYARLSDRQQMLLARQSEVMAEYGQILQTRLDEWVE